MCPFLSHRDSRRAWKVTARALNLKGILLISETWHPGGRLTHLECQVITEEAIPIKLTVWVLVAQKL